MSGFGSTVCGAMIAAAATQEQETELLPRVYEELRKIAAAQMSHGQSGSTLQPTALVHEAWLKLGGRQHPEWQSRAHFFAAAAETMRHILIDRARRRRALRHGGGQLRINVDDIEIEDSDLELEAQYHDRLVALSEAVERLAVEHPRMAELVKLRCFAGLEIHQVATALGISRATAHRWWLFARTWLYRELHGGEDLKPAR